jgi:UDP-N-acetylmuramyl pentapeptide phosphotransferase/UDP-N-acetylglucosamine-1-phosphate transferase
LLSDSGLARRGAWIAAVAILAAPFLALLYRTEAGLIVMALALGAVSLLLRDALREVSPQARRWLRLILGFNLVLAVACVALATWLFVTNG